MSATLYHGDCLEVMATLPAQSVQTCITSPPYFNLRDYQTGRWDGGDPACDHGAARIAKRQAGRQTDLDGGVPGSLRDKPRTSCACGAQRVDGQIGNERTLPEYVARLVAVFREVRRVLRDDGTLWLNLGDSFGKGKQQLLVPHRVAMALQDDGWILRSTIVWHKPNCMPASVTDRPTDAHEYIFLLSKRGKYYYNADAVREPNETPQHLKEMRRHHTERPNNGATDGKGIGGYRMGSIHSGRNRRTVWTVSTTPYRGAHFATFPPKLIEPCVLAGSAARACEGCGAPWAPVVERETISKDKQSGKNWLASTEGIVLGRKTDPNSGLSRDVYQRSTVTGYAPTCRCDASGTGRSVVLDPFSGAGTTGVVAVQHGRDYIGIDLNAAYLDLSRPRIEAVQPLLLEVA